MPETDYVTALIQDLDADLPHVWGRALHSIFIGGGTPSLFSGEAIDRLLSEVRARFQCAPDMEVTLEANPGTVEQQFISEYAKAGINRLSIGIQSFHDHLLKKLGRIHDGGEARRAVEVAKQAGIDNINIDIMHGLPDQTIEEAMADLKQAIECEPTHISWYQLTLEPNTVFYKQQPVLPNDDVIWEMEETGFELLANNGFKQYEVSAFSKPGLQCQHNLNYWQFGDYLGIGAGAHGKITSGADQSITRTRKIKQPKHYLAADQYLAEENVIDGKDLPFEFMLNTLRLTQGFDKYLFSERTGLQWNKIAPQLDQAKELDLIIENSDGIMITELGRRFVNQIVSLFI